MLCPHCGLGIHFEEYDNKPVYPYDREDRNGIGVELAHGFCPQCDEIIVILREGEYVKYDDYDERLLSISKEEIVYPKLPLTKALDNSIPEMYREDYAEARNVLPFSPKASAAITRRMLQHILREHYGIHKGTLDREIEVFIHLGQIPSHITEAVDAVRNVGNFAAHPLKDTNTGEIMAVEPGEAEWLLEVIESLLDFSFVQPTRIQERRDKLNKKLDAMGKPPLKS